jgi:hypothetical protein
MAILSGLRSPLSGFVQTFPLKSSGFLSVLKTQPVCNRRHSLSTHNPASGSP